MGYNAKVYRKQGGAELVVADGGKVTVESGGIIDPGPVAASNAVGGLLEIFYVLADQAGGANKDVTVTYKIRVLDVIVVNKAAGGAGDTITVQNGTSAITNAMDTNKADTTITRAGTIDDAQHEIAAGGTLRVAKANGANDPSCEVYVLAMRVA